MVNEVGTVVVLVMITVVPLTLVDVGVVEDVVAVVVVTRLLE